MLVEIDELVSQADIADMLGVGPSTVSNWLARHDDFPVPVGTVGRGRTMLFLRSDVLAWRERREMREHGGARPRGTGTYNRPTKQTEGKGRGPDARIAHPTVAKWHR